MKNRRPLHAPLSHFVSPSARRHAERIARSNRHVQSHQTIDKPEVFDGWVPEKWKRHLIGKGVSDFAAFERALEERKAREGRDKP